MTDWANYRACRTCKVGTGEQCIHTTLQTTRGRDVLLDDPHPGRKLKKGPPFVCGTQSLDAADIITGGVVTSKR